MLQVIPLFHLLLVANVAKCHHISPPLTLVEMDSKIHGISSMVGMNIFGQKNTEYHGMLVVFSNKDKYGINVIVFRLRWHALSILRNVGFLFLYWSRFVRL